MSLVVIKWSEAQNGGHMKHSDASSVSICSVLELFHSQVHLRIKGNKTFPLKVSLTFHLSRLRALLKIHAVEIFTKKTSPALGFTRCSIFYLPSLAAAFVWFWSYFSVYFRI